MDEVIIYPSGVIFNAYNARKLAVIGATEDWTNVTISLYDFDRRNWQKIEYYSNQCLDIKSPGICFDELRCQMYLGGGDILKVSQYDLRKEKWYHLPNTHRRYSQKHTLLWIDGMNRNLLFIACSEINSFQYIDIRENKRWTTIHSDSWNRTSVQNAFGIKDQIPPPSRLLIS